MISIENSLTPDNRITLETGQIARVLSIGTSWNVIRIGCRLAFDDVGVNFLSSPRFYMGVLANPVEPLTNGPLDIATSHFVGNIDQNLIWTRATGPVRYSASSNTSVKGKKVGSTITGVGVVAGASRIISGTPATRLVQIVEITKGSPNFTILVVMHDNAGSVVDTTITHLETAMEAANITAAVAYLNAQSIGSWTNVHSTVSTVAVDESTDGFLNAVCVGWNRTIPRCYVSEILFNKIS